MISAILLLLHLCCGYEFICDGEDWREKPRINLNEKEVLTPTIHGFSVIVDATDEEVSRTILETGGWDVRLLTLVAAFVKPGDSVVNLGAQVGLEAVMMGKLVGPTGKLIVFEPYSVSYKIVVKNLEINGLSGYSQVYKYGAGEKEATLALHINKENTGMTRFVPNTAKSDGSEQVEVKTFDSVVGDQHVDFILMDVEMFEVQALTGMKNLLKRSPGIVVLMEWIYLLNPVRDEARAKEMLDWLAGEGFKWFRYSYQDKCVLGAIQQIKALQILQVLSEDLLLVGRDAKLPKFA